MKTLEVSRNRSTGYGPVLCEGCWLFFDDDKRKNISNYHSISGDQCKQHKGKVGYDLLKKLSEVKK
jgi:hypothetical protein